MAKLCICGCGKEIKGRRGAKHYPGHQNRGRKLTVEQVNRIRLSCKKGTENHAYNGGLWTERKSGRCYIRCRNGHGYPYYRAVMEAHLKRKLLKNEIVHHINGDPSDDRIENLQLLPWGKHSSISNKRYTKKQMVEKLREFFNDHKERPTIKSWGAAKIGPNVKTYQVYFGTWNNALKEAGLL